MVNALGAIFNMPVEVLRVARAGPHSRKDSRQVKAYAQEACRLLEIAGDQLITEANGVTPGQKVGPVVTPEAVLILTIERLVHGVYGKGIVSVINILEECLEQLVSHPCTPIVMNGS